MRLITLYVTEQLLSGIEDLVQAGVYPNRSEAIRLAIKDLLEMHRK